MALNPLLKKLVSDSANKYKRNDSNLSKLKEGRNVIRLIVPAPNSVAWVKDDGMFYREVGVHWIKPDENAKPIAVVGSEEICFQRVSTLAAAIDMAIASAHDEESKALYESWKARKSILLNVVNRDANDEVQIMELSPTTFGKILDVIALYDANGVDVIDHTVGMDLVITRNGKGKQTTYDVQPIPLPPGKTCKPVTEDQVRQAADLDAFITQNYFRGDEPKALSAVVQIAGISMPRLGAPATPVAALTSAAATVADAPIAQAVMPAAPVAAPAPVAPVAPVVVAAVADPAAEIARLQALIAAQAAQQAAAAAPAAAPAAAEPVSAETTLASIPQDEQDRLLDELESIGK